MQIKFAIRAMVYAPLRGHSFAAEITLQMPRRIWRLLQQLERVVMKRGYNLLPQLRAQSVHIEVATLTPVAPLPIRQCIPTPVAFLSRTSMVVLRHERQGVLRMQAAPQRGLQGTTHGMKIILARLAMISWSFPNLKAQIAYKFGMLIRRHDMVH